MNKKAFTLIEVILVVAIIAMLAGITAVAINPTRQLDQANDATIKGDLNAIANAIYQFSFDNGGSFPTALTGTLTEIGSGGSQIDLCNDLTPDYIVEIPFDISDQTKYFTDCGDYTTGYTIRVDGGTSRLELYSANANQGNGYTLEK